jgi:hypothetical protein
MGYQALSPDQNHHCREPSEMLAVAVKACRIPVQRPGSTACDTRAAFGDLSPARMCVGEKINARRTIRLVLFLAAVAVCGGGGAQVCGCGNDDEAFPTGRTFGQERSDHTVAASTASPAISIQSINDVFVPIGFMGAPLSTTGSSRTDAPIRNYGSSLIELPAQLPSPTGYLISTNLSRLRSIAAERKHLLMQSGAQFCAQNRAFNSYSFELQLGEFCD